MEIFFLIPGSMMVVLPWIVLGVLVLCGVVYAGLRIWTYADDRKEAKEKAAHDAMVEEMRGAYFRKRDGYSD